MALPVLGRELVELGTVPTHPEKALVDLGNLIIFSEAVPSVQVVSWVVHASRPSDPLSAMTREC
jgi:hypothetical protein